MMMESVGGLERSAATLLSCPASLAHLTAINGSSSAHPNPLCGLHLSATVGDILHFKGNEVYK